MLSDNFSYLCSWLQSIQSKLHVVEGLPTWTVHERPDKPTASIHIFQIEQAPQRLSTSSVSGEFRIYYLVIFNRLEDLDSVLAAALSQSDFMLDLTSKPPQFWQALNIPPQAALFLCANVAIDVSRDVAPPVRQRMTIRHEPVSSLIGYVRGPDDQAVLRAEVRNTATGEVSLTDRHGMFQLSAVPDSPTDILLTINFKGRELTSVQSSKKALEQPMIVKITAKEMENAYV